MSSASAPAYGRRRRGSARFDPYYKIQLFRDIDFTWEDVQVRHDTEAGARAAYPAGKRCRVMRVDMHGRAPVPGSDTGEAT